MGAVRRLLGVVLRLQCPKAKVALVAEKCASGVRLHVVEKGTGVFSASDDPPRRRMQPATSSRVEEEPQHHDGAAWP